MTANCSKANSIQSRSLGAPGKQGPADLYFFGKILVPYYHISIACFLEDIDPISKMFNDLLDRSSGFCGACIFQTFWDWRFPKKWDSPKQCFCKVNSDFPNFVEVSWCLQRTKQLVSGWKHTLKNPEITQVRVLGFSYDQIEKLYVPTWSRTIPRSF